jgi:hypothetical protein
MSWFRDLTGFAEGPEAELREQLFVEGEDLVSRVNQRRCRIGCLETPSLGELRPRTENVDGAQLRVSEWIGDVRDIYRDPANAGALFQVASQFNLLEMIGPNVTPADGVTRYEDDWTQGPASAIACGAATIWRNYFVPHQGTIGQTGGTQIDCLAELGAILDNPNQRFWVMSNGYALAEPDGLARLNAHLLAMSPSERDGLRDQVRIGLQHDAEVTLERAGHRVTQAFCSALPIAYGREPVKDWEPFARLVLEAAYEATLHAALLNARRTGNPNVWMTLLGGGAFGNPRSWIISALERALRLFSASGLHVRIVSYAEPNPAVAQLILKLRAAGMAATPKAL